MYRSSALRSAALLLMLGFAAGAIGAEVEGLRVWAGPDKTRAVLDLDQTVEYRIFTLRNPDRVVVDLESARLSKTVQIPDGSGNLLQRIRSGARDATDLRIVFDLKSIGKPKSFLLPPAEQYGHRLVIDLYPQESEEASEPVKSTEDVARLDRDIVIAIDAGHGGEDPGAIGPAGSHEKNVVLAIAREVKRLVDQEPGFRGELVRDGDYYIAHRERPAQARKWRADLFVSIHADAFYDRRVRGSSVYVLSTGRASSEAAKWLADRENRSDLVGGVKLDDKDATLAAVLLDLSQSASMEASVQAADRVLDALARVDKPHKRRVEKASFAVLTAPDMPSMLVETGFISNPAEEKRLTSPQGRAQIARAIFAGLIDYFEQTPPPGTWLARNGGRGRHIVARGETLSEIARQHRVSLSRLRAANGIQSDLLRVGDVLKIPAG